MCTLQGSCRLIFTERLVFCMVDLTAFFVAIHSMQPCLCCGLLQEPWFLFAAVSCVQNMCVVLIVLWWYCEVHGRGVVRCAPLWSSILQTQC